MWIPSNSKRSAGGWLLGALAAVSLGAAAPASANSFVYATQISTTGAGSVAQFVVGAGAGLLQLPFPPAPSGVSPEAVAVTPDGNNAYVADGGTTAISQYSINPSTGALSPKAPDQVAAGVGPVDIAVSPGGLDAYVPAIHGISQYDIDPSTGALVAKLPDFVSTGGQPARVAISPDGNRVYVTSFNSSSVFQFDVDPQTGDLTPKPHASVPAGNGPLGITVTPDGKSVYVTNTNDNTVSEYNVDPKTGALSAKPTPTIITGRSPDAVAVTPDGHDAYVANFGDNSVVRYAIDPSTGALSLRRLARTATGNHPRHMLIAPDGNSLYVASDNTINQYDIGTDGALTPKSPPTVAAAPLTPGIALAKPTLSLRCLPCVTSVNVSLPRNAGALITGHLGVAESVGIIVARFAAGRFVRVGRVPLGRHRKGPLRILWNLRVTGPKLPKGRYQITLRAFDNHQRVIAVAHPIPLTIP